MIALDLSSWIQAISATVIAAFTVVLGIATWHYANRTRQLVDEARRSNEMVLDNTRRLLRANAPRLTVVARPGDVAPGPREGQMIAGYDVRNVGATTAHNIMFSFAHGEGGGVGPLQPGETGVVRYYGPLPYGEHPAVSSVSFADPGGTRWVQRYDEKKYMNLEQIPELAETDE